MTLSSIKPSAFFNALSDQHMIVPVGFNNPSGIDTTIQHIAPKTVTKSIQEIIPEYNEDMPRNLMELPYNPDDAIVSGLATQRGGHKPYSDWFAEQIKTIKDRMRTGEITRAEAKDEVLDFIDETRCRHNRTQADLYEQIKLHKNDPNAAMTQKLQELGLSPDEIASAMYTRRLHQHNKAHNPDYAQLTEQASDPTVPLKPANSGANKRATLAPPDEAAPPSKDDIDDDNDNACGGGNKTGVTIAPVPSDEAETSQDAPPLSSAMLATARYAASHPRMVSAISASAEATAALSAEGLPLAKSTRGASLLPAAGAGLTTTALASIAAVGIAQEAGAMEMSTTYAVSPEQAIPSLAELHKTGGDVMGPRTEVNQIAVRMTGLPAGSLQNMPRALYQQDLEAGLDHSKGHLLLKADGSLLRDDAFMRPFDSNPRIAAGFNANTLGVMAEGDRLTPAQIESLHKIESALKREWQQDNNGAGTVHLFGARPEERAMLAFPAAQPPNTQQQLQQKTGSSFGSPR